jgi:hypothetical protein
MLLCSCDIGIMRTAKRSRHIPERDADVIPKMESLYGYRGAAAEQRARRSIYRSRLLSTWIVQQDSQVGNRSSSAAKILLR